MIRRIVYTNVQKHAKKVIDLDPYCTTLAGPTEAGKSALVRGLYWACLNQPSGDGIVKAGAREASVKIYTKTHKVVRSRGKGRNVYQLDGKTYKAFGQGVVPPPVAAALNVGEDNFRLQLDPHFWFSDTAGQVSAKLNEVVNLSLIDSALDHVTSAVRKARAEVEVTAEQLATANQEMDALAWVPGYLRQAEAVNTLDKEYRAKSHRIARIAIAAQKARRLTQALDNATAATLEAQNVVDLGKQAGEAAEHAQTIEKLVRRARTLQKLAKVDLTPFDDLAEQRAAADAYAERIRTIELLVDRGRKQEREICRLDQELAELESNLAQVRACPTCGQVLPGSPPSSHPICTYAPTARSQEQRKVMRGTT